MKNEQTKQQTPALRLCKNELLFARLLTNKHCIFHMHLYGLRVNQKFTIILISRIKILFLLVEECSLWWTCVTLGFKFISKSSLPRKKKQPEKLFRESLFKSKISFLNTIHLRKWGYCTRKIMNTGHTSQFLISKQLNITIKSAQKG